MKSWEMMKHLGGMDGMRIMNNLTKSEFMKMYNEGENLSDKPIFIDFYATW